jgi:hypothetical protein
MSSVLSGLKIVAASKPHALPVVVRRRHKLISRLNQQRELANAKINGEVYLPKRLRSFIDKATGERYAKEVPVRIKSWWWIGEQGELLLQVKYGSRVIEFGKGKSAIEIQSEHQICDVIDALITAVNNGELDAQLENLGKQLRDGFKR